MTSAPGSLSSISLPSRRATSRHRSFSIRPCGPMVPVSWPPWPASITMRLIFKPRARVRERWPSRVGLGTDGGSSAAIFGVLGLRHRRRRKRPSASRFDFAGTFVGREFILASVRLAVSACEATAASLSLAAHKPRLEQRRRMLIGAVDTAFSARSLAVDAAACGRRLRGRGRAHVDHQPVWICQQKRGIIFGAIHIQHHTHDTLFVLRDAQRFQQAVVDIPGLVGELGIELAL